MSGKSIIVSCKNCGCRFSPGPGSVPRIEPCPSCGDGVLVTNEKQVRSDSRSFWAGFFFGWLGVLWSGAQRGRSGVDHALGGHFAQELFGFIAMAIFFIVLLLMVVFKFAWS